MNMFEMIVIDTWGFCFKKKNQLIDPNNSRLLELHI